MLFKVYDMTTGLEKMTDERHEQIIKHGFNSESDTDIFHQCGELKEAAMYLLSDGACPFPPNWNPDWKKKFYGKTKIERLVVAGALLAAEIDRLQYVKR